MRMRRSHLAAALAASALGLVACGGSNEPTVSQGQDAPAAPSAGTTGMQHIHGLGVRGRTLYIATHGGLWVASDGQTTARRVGESQQDIMGFSVVSNDRFIGSGHPHPSQQDQPPNLGLIASRDGGKWFASDFAPHIARLISPHVGACRACRGGVDDDRPVERYRAFGP
ncbi:MAG: hypothetical protein ACR2H2_00595, partial [Solirubrobacteraceae bacterium]